MQIAQIAPLTKTIPPKLYGDTERVISWLSDELVALGHDVVLFASGDPETAANLELADGPASRWLGLIEVRSGALKTGLSTLLSALVT